MVVNILYSLHTYMYTEERRERFEGRISVYRVLRVLKYKLFQIYFW